MTKELKIMLVIAAVVLVGGIALFFTSTVTPVTPGGAVDSQSLVRETSHMTGNKDAKVTIVEFGDYQCPFCAQVEPMVERLRQEYKNNAHVNFVFRNFPLSQHTKALVTAEAAEAAGEQGKFWEMHDWLYANQDKWVSGDHMVLIENAAREMGLDMGKFRDSWKGEKFAEVITADSKDGESLGVTGTPTFFINGEKTKSYNYDELKATIEIKLK